MERFEEALVTPWPQSAPSGGGIASPGFQVDLAASGGKDLLKKIRRSDKLSKMAVLAASEALSREGMSDSEGRKVGLIVATAFGPHVTTFNFLDDILDYGESSVSPTTFSNSVHNAAASYVAKSFNIQGPTMTVTQFFHSFHQGLRLAQAWLREKRCEQVLVGAVDQVGPVLQYVYDTKLNAAPDGKIRPFDFSPTYQVPGEGAVFFLVSPEASDQDYCGIEAVSDGREQPQGGRPDLHIIDTDGLLPDESVYAPALSGDIPTAAYSPVFGSMMVGSAFNCAAAALMLKKQTVYANPVMDNPHDLNLVGKSGNKALNVIASTRFDCHHDRMTITLTKCSAVSKTT